MCYHPYMICDEIRARLQEMGDPSVAEFNAKLIPNRPREHFLGIKTPELRSYAKVLSKDPTVFMFLKDLPHMYFEEDQLHAFILSGIRDFEVCVSLLDEFLSYVDNWATCDSLLPRIFVKHRDELLPYISLWLSSSETYRIRYGIGSLMRYFLDEGFDVSYPMRVSSLRSDEYYVNMMIAWYFATALAKQYDAVLPFIEKGSLDKWTHNKTIQKAVESFRITGEHKAYLRTLKRR